MRQVLNNRIINPVIDTKIEKRANYNSQISAKTCNIGLYKTVKNV